MCEGVTNIYTNLCLCNTGKIRFFSWLIKVRSIGRAVVVQLVRIVDILGLLREGQLGLGQPGPVVGVGAPGVGMLERESQPVVDGCDTNLCTRPLLENKSYLFVISF